MREVCSGAGGRGLQPGHAVHVVRCGALLGSGGHIVCTVCCGDERCRQQCLDAVCGMWSWYVLAGGCTRWLHRVCGRPLRPRRNDCWRWKLRDQV